MMKKFYYYLGRGELELYDGKCDNAHDIVLDVYKDMFDERDVGRGLKCAPIIEIFDENKESLGVFETWYELDIKYYCEPTEWEEQ